MRKLSRKLTQPAHTEKDNQCFATLVTVNGTEPLVLLDSRCTSDSISSEFVAVVNMKIHELEEPVLLQLGTVGSQFKINFGLGATVEVGGLQCKHYLNMVNIDWYDLILEILFMQRHGFILDFEKDKVHVRGKILKTVVKGESTHQQACQYAMRKAPKAEP